MNKKIDTIGALILLLVTIISIGFIGFKSPINFDSAYNLLAYQSLFNGEGFKYNYGTHNVYFDPTISTGPELYFPTYILWEIIGQTNYEMAVVVFMLYVIALLFLIFFVILRDFKYKSYAVLFFIFFIVTNSNIINDHAFWNPLGEIVSTFFIVSGFYLLCKQKYIIGPLLLGFALDVKTNIIVALVPTVFIFYVIEYYIPFLKQAEYKKIIKVSIAGLLMFIPFIFYNKILPFIFLNDQQYNSLAIEKQNRFLHVLDRGFGQFIKLKNEFDFAGIQVFLQSTNDKITILMQFLHTGSYIIFILFFVLLIYLSVVSYKNKLFSFYLFLFSGFILLWWLLATVDPWYRYFAIVDILFVIGFILMFPFFLDEYNNGKKLTVIVIFLFVVFVSVGRFSYISIQSVLNDKSKYDMIKMVNYINDNNIDSNEIYTYGWFQAPQIMLLLNKRFNDLLIDEEEKDNKYYLETVENTIIKDEVKVLEDKFLLIYESGYNKLFIIRDYDN